MIRVIALAALLVLAGCQGQPTQATTTTTTEVTTVPTTTVTETTTETTTEPTTPPALDASITYPDCHTVQVSSDSYSWIGIITQNGSSEHHGQYTGTNEFETESVIVSVIVAHDGRDVDVRNPEYEECVAPQTTTTTTQATVTTTQTPTATTTAQTPTTTRTPTETPTTTTQTTTRPPLEEHRILEFTANETLGENATVTRELGNAHEYAVEFAYDVIWMQARNGGDDKMLTVTRVHVTIPAGERVKISVRYPGNERVDWVRYEVRYLEYVDQ